MALKTTTKSEMGGVRVPTTKVVGTGAGAGANLGFQDLAMSDVYKPRLIVCSSGHQKKGKTHFSLTTPGEKAYFSFHKGLEGVGQKFIQNRDIKIANYEWERPTKDEPTDRVQKQSAMILDRFETDFEWAATNMKSLILDDATDLWSLLRLANFGKLTANAMNYGDLNALFIQWIRRVQSGDNNLIMLHKVKDEWENFTDSSGKVKGRRTGKFVRDGYKGAEFDAHVCLVHDRDYAPTDTDPKIATGPMFFQVYDCRQAPELVGMQFIQDQSPDCTFMELAMMCYPDSKESDWK